VLQRAVQIDAMRGSRVADVRAAATEAGISPEAFDQAMAELETETGSTVSPAPTRGRSLLIVASAFAIALAGVYFARRAVPVEAPAATVEQSIVLRCLSPQQAAELLRPVLGETGTVESRGDASQVVTVRGTGEQVERARAMLEERDANACPVPTAP